LSNYYFNDLNTSGEASFLTNENVWRWMLGIEFIPAIIYFFALFFIPKSPRWLYTRHKDAEAEKVLIEIHGDEKAKEESKEILVSLQTEDQNKNDKVTLTDLLKPSLKFVLTVGLVIGVLQQITGINAVYFYATSIFKQTGIGTDAAFSQGVLLSFTSLLFTIVAIFLIDRMGRRPLLLFGLAGISISLLLCAYGFNEATYKLEADQIAAFEFDNRDELEQYAGKTFSNDVDFKNAMKSSLGNQVYGKNEGAILEAATSINATLVLIGVLGFIACFAFSLGPVMLDTHIQNNLRFQMPNQNPIEDPFLFFDQESH